VQGDERDAIILSIGYGKHPDGRMRYQWGPLLRDGGERRLNVAATRAKHRLTLVSSFSGHDVDPDRVTKAGARMLADYLDYASSGGAAEPASGAADLNPFEADVRERLAAAGITVVPQYGVGGYRVDFAATHPRDPSRMVLAIEADGASYWQSGSVRDRDRLRGEHLQRLGWQYHRLWSTNWFRNPDDEVARVQEAYERAVSAAEPDESRPGKAHDEQPASKPSGPRPSEAQRAEPRPGASAPGQPQQSESRARPPSELGQPATSRPGQLELPAGTAEPRAGLVPGDRSPAELASGDPARAGLPSGDSPRAILGAGDQPRAALDSARLSQNASES
jgi:very-short-patch-repair endonuclease